MKKNDKKNILVIGGGIVLLVFVLAMFTIGGSEPALAVDAQLYKSNMCGCCGTYGDYAGKSLALEIVEHDDVTDVKDGFEIPSELRSCHTTVIEGYYVEGHVPMEAIEKLLNERPDLKGIALPGMPSGVPGMPGPKEEPWIVYAVGQDGSVSEFMTI